MRKITTAVLMAALLASMSVTLPSCSPRFARVLAAGLIIGTTMAVLSRHRPPPPDCEPEVVIDGRDVYHYEGRWMYYDEDEGQWYTYVEEPVEVQDRYDGDYGYDGDYDRRGERSNDGDWGRDNTGGR